MKRVPVKASKSVSQAGRIKVATIRISDNKATISGKAAVKTK